jgi:hypothetical protein
MADVIELGDRDTAKRQAALNSLALSGFTSTAPSVFPLTFSTHAGVSPAAFNDIWTLKLTKIGLVNRKGGVALIVFIISLNVWFRGFA